MSNQLGLTKITIQRHLIDRLAIKTKYLNNYIINRVRSLLEQTVWGLNKTGIWQKKKPYKRGANNYLVI